MIIATIDGGLLLVVYRQQNLGRSPSIILRIDRSMDFFLKSLKAKCLSFQLTIKLLEIAALCMVCAVLSVFVRVVLLPVLINLCHFNTARPQFYAILNLFLVSLPWLEAPPVSFPIAQ